MFVQNFDNDEPDISTDALYHANRAQGGTGVYAKYYSGPLIGEGANGVVMTCTEKATQARFACKAVNVGALLLTRDGPNIHRRLRNEIGIMSYLAGE